MSERNGPLTPPSADLGPCLMERSCPYRVALDEPSERAEMGNATTADRNRSRRALAIGRHLLRLANPLVAAVLRLRVHHLLSGSARSHC